MAYKDPEVARTVGRLAYAGHTDEQRAAHRARSNASMKRWYAKSPANRAKVRASQRSWRANNREWQCMQNSLLRHGLTLDQYHARLESQDFACAICSEVVDLVIDHHHGSGKRRGLLCYSCNSGIGALRESPQLFQRATQYLTRWI